MSSGYIMFLALIGGAVILISQVLIVPAFGNDARTRKLLRRKLAEIDPVDAQRQVASLLREKYLRDLSPLARRLEDSPHMESLARLIEQSGVGILAHQLVILAIVLAAGGAIAGMIATGNLAIASLAMAAGGAAPFIYVSRKR